MNNKDYAWLLPAAAVSLAAGILIGRAAEAWLLLLVMLPCAVGACALLREHGRFAAIQALVLAVGCALGYAAYHPSLPEAGNYTVSGVVAEEIRLREDGQVRTVLRSVSLNGQPLGSGAYWSFYLREGEALPEGLVPGSRVSLTARVYHPDDAENPGGYNFREYLLQKGTTIGLYGCDALTAEESWHPLGLAVRWRSALTQRLMAVMGEEAGGYAATMLLGSQHLVPTEDREAFKRLGIAHILSVSGFHVGILAGLMTKLLRRMHLARKKRFACTAGLLTLYCLLTGLNAPVVRATILFLLYEFGALKHRQRSSLHLLSVSWILQLLFSPVQLTSLSFQLTYGAMLGLTQVAPWLEGRWSPKRCRKPWRLFCSALGTQAGILLPELYWFQELPVLGVLLNIVVIGAATGLMLLCWATLLVLGIQPLAAVFGQLTASLLNGMLILVRDLGAIEGITLWTCRANLLTAAGWLLLMLAASWWWGKKHRPLVILLGAVLIACSVYPWPNAGTSYIQFSVGEADAALLRDGEFALVIDTGEDGMALAEYLHQRCISLDALVLTHLHSDHAGGIRALLDERIPVEICYLPWGAQDALVDEGMLLLVEELAAAGTSIVYLSRGDRIDLPSGGITVLWPEAGRVRPEQEANESSMTLRAEVKGSTILLAGDLDGRYEMYAAAPADLLKIAHHGSKSSTSQAFLDQVAPQLLILSGDDKEKFASMEERRGDIPMVATCTQGAVIIEFDDGGFTVETMR